MKKSSKTGKKVEERGAKSSSLAPAPPLPPPAAENPVPAASPNIILVSAKQLAQLFRVGERTISEWLASGRVQKVANGKFILQTALDYHTELHAMDLTVFKSAQADKALMEIKQIEATIELKREMAAESRGRRIAGLTADGDAQATLLLKLLGTAAERMRDELAVTLRGNILRLVVGILSGRPSIEAVAELDKESFETATSFTNWFFAYTLGAELDPTASDLFAEVTGMQTKADTEESPTNLHYTTNGINWDHMRIPPASFYRYQLLTPEEQAARRAEDGKAHYWRLEKVEGPKLPTNMLDLLRRYSAKIKSEAT